MIEFNQAIQIAQDYYNNRGELSLTKIYESELMWVVYAGKKDQPKFGNAGISIDKATGEIKAFVLPSKQNFEILKKAKLTELQNKESE